VSKEGKQLAAHKQHDEQVALFVWVQKGKSFFPVLCFAHPPDALCISAVKNCQLWLSTWPPDPLAKGMTVKALSHLPLYLP
jgi:hypothetical protein